MWIKKPQESGKKISDYFRIERNRGGRISSDYRSQTEFRSVRDQKESNQKYIILSLS